MTRDSYLIGLIGSGIGNSFSPMLHEREADLHGLRYLYRLIDLDRINTDPGRVGQLVGAARGMGYRGLNITHPCKQIVIECLDELTPQAEAVGAVNTVVFEGEGRSARAVGHNTDVSGFAASFDRELADAPRERVVLLGAGGAGAAIAHALLAHGIGHLDVVDPLTDRADGLVHATPTGMPAHAGLPLSADLLDPGLWVVDVVYQPLEIELLGIARARGCVAFNGVGMVVFQAADAFQLFTGREPDRARMLAHVAELAESE
jgi:shikimate dehydrogenase